MKDQTISLRQRFDALNAALVRDAFSRDLESQSIVLPSGRAISRSKSAESSFNCMDGHQVG